MKDKTLASVVKSAREKLGISQRELSRRTGIDNNTLAKIEKSERKKPNVLSLRKLSMVLGIDVKKLMKLCDYTKEEIEIIDNKIYTNIAIKNDDSSITLIDEYIKNFKYDILAKNVLLDFINKKEYKNVKEYENLKQTEKNKVDKAFKNIVNTINEDIEKMEYAIVHIDDNKTKK